MIVTACMSPFSMAGYKSSWSPGCPARDRALWHAGPAMSPLAPASRRMSAPCVTHDQGGISSSRPFPGVTQIKAWPVRRGARLHDHGCSPSSCNKRRGAVCAPPHSLIKSEPAVAPSDLDLGPEDGGSARGFDLLQQAARAERWIIDVRRALHHHHELSFHVIPAAAPLPHGSGSFLLPSRTDRSSYPQGLAGGVCLCVTH